MTTQSAFMAWPCTTSLTIQATMTRVAPPKTICQKLLGTARNTSVQITASQVGWMLMAPWPPGIDIPPAAVEP
ncbi:MAG: hypothetical protein M3065_16185 [Actinomycetota bacterium]|nr:hypothetical protein [Actinomycetota bacterium]